MFPILSPHSSQFTLPDLFKVIICGSKVKGTGKQNRTASVVSWRDTLTNLVGMGPQTCLLLPTTHHSVLVSSSASSSLSASPDAFAEIGVVNAMP